MIILDLIKQTTCQYTEGKKRGTYQRLSDKERATIGKFTAYCGVARAAVI